ncbi:MAG: hypothetical protein Q9187_004733, partial [Circinaria calcarea]
SKHGFADFEIQLLRGARDGTEPSTYGHKLATDRSNAMEMEADNALDAQFANFITERDMMDNAHRDLVEDIEEAAARGGQFWVGGGGGGYDMDMGDEWDKDEMEMQRLITGDRGADGDEMMIDPVLR